MALRLGEHLICGELRNTENYVTNGTIVLQGDEGERTLYLHLTGNCDPDLAGLHVRLRRGPDSPPPSPIDRADFFPLARQQVGPTGPMTAEGWVKALPCSRAEYFRRYELGEPPPTRWTRRLLLEWHSQDGCVVVELAGVVVERCVREPEGEEDAGDWVPLPNLAVPPLSMLREPRETAAVSNPFPGDREEESFLLDWLPGQGVEGEEPGGLPDGLQRHFDRQAEAIDRLLGAEAYPESPMSGAPLPHAGRAPDPGWLADAAALPRDEALDDAAVEELLKDLLAEMAALGIALDVCAHFTPRDCYRLLRDTIFPRESLNLALLERGHVQHYLTHDHCDVCEAELDQLDFGEEER